MNKYKLQNPLPPGELEWTFDADNLKVALQKILFERPTVMRFTLIVSGKSKHYKKVGVGFVRIPHRDFDDYPMDRLGDMCRDIGIVYRLSKHERLSLMDDVDEKVRTWMYNRYIMDYLGDGYHSLETEEGKMTLILDDNEVRSGTFLKEKGLVKSFIEVSTHKKSLLEQQRQQKKATVALENQLREREKELENLRETVSTLEETLKETLRNFQTKIDTLTQENISLQSALTLDTFVPDGLTEKVSETERLISAFEGIDLVCDELNPKIIKEKKFDFQEALEKRIAEAFSNLGGQEASILNRDEKGELQNPTEYRKFVNDITIDFLKNDSPGKKIKKRD